LSRTNEKSLMPHISSSPLSFWNPEWLRGGAKLRPIAAGLLKGLISDLGTD
jgi:hypothetical protein